MSPTRSPLSHPVGACEKVNTCLEENVVIQEHLEGQKHEKLHLQVRSNQINFENIYAQTLSVCGNAVSKHLSVTVKHHSMQCYRWPERARFSAKILG